MDRLRAIPLFVELKDLDLRPHPLDGLVMRHAAQRLKSGWTYTRLAVAQQPDIGAQMGINANRTCRTATIRSHRGYLLGDLAATPCNVGQVPAKETARRQRV
jgi:hypothetical protein